MRIRCIANTGDNLPENYLDPRVGYTKELKFPLKIGKEYAVYALYTWQGQVWYYICDDNYIYYPQENPAPLFAVVDSRVSQYWQIEIAENGLLTMAFSEWFSQPYFYDKLTDQEQAEVDFLAKVKYLLDSEFKSQELGQNMERAIGNKIVKI